MFVLFPSSVWNSNKLERVVTNTSPGQETKSLKMGYPLSFLGKSFQSIQCKLWWNLSALGLNCLVIGKIFYIPVQAWQEYCQQGLVGGVTNISSRREAKFLKQRASTFLPSWKESNQTCYNNDKILRTSLIYKEEQREFEKMLLNLIR